ncbi:MAG: response regulator, partial [Myxococcota bacterium]
MGSLGEESSVLSVGPLIWSIDDESEMRDLLRDLLEEGGYRFAGFADPARALAATADPPDLILLDLLMPTMGGLECLRALRQDPFTHRTPIMIVSARASGSALANLFEAGADDFVEKPFHIVDLMTRMRRHLVRARHMDELLRRHYARGVLLECARRLGGREDVPAALAEVLER